jgi:ADP-ribose pyrophosphatase
VAGGRPYETIEDEMREATRKVTVKYEGPIFTVESIDVELEDGTRAVRDVVRHSAAVAVLAGLPDGRFAWVRQFRKPVDRHQLEIVAGLREPGEAAQDAALRELQEETGLIGNKVIFLGEVYPTPGYVDERIDLFYIEVSAEKGCCHLDPDERVEVVLLDREEIIGKIRSHEITDGKSLAAWLLFEKIVEEEPEGE